MNSTELQQLLAQNRLVSHFYCYAELDSTMEQARRLIAQAGTSTALHGTLILSDKQTSGRGRHGRKWESPAGSSVLGTFILARSALPACAEGTQLSLLASALPVAVCTGLRRVIPEARIKYPNDIVSDGRKLGGILLEASGDAILAGFGVNCMQTLGDFPPNLKMPATSIFLETGKVPSREKTVAAVASELERLLQADVYFSAGDEMRELCETLGRSVVLELVEGQMAQGLARTITPEGVLILETTAGERRIFTSQVVRTWTPESEQVS